MYILKIGQRYLGADGNVHAAQSLAKRSTAEQKAALAWLVDCPSVRPDVRMVRLITRAERAERSERVE